MHRASPHRAEQAGIAALAVHGRTRDQQYTGVAEYDTIAAIKAQLSIPVIANGDIDSPQKAAFVLRHTGCDAVMVGRAAQGRPWIFREIAHYLASGELLPEPTLPEVRDILLGHLAAPARVLRRTGRRAHRAQASGLVREGSAGEHRPSAQWSTAPKPRRRSCA